MLQPKVLIKKQKKLNNVHVMFTRVKQQHVAVFLLISFYKNQQKDNVSFTANIKED